MHWTRTPAASPTLLPYRYNIHHSPKDARTPASPNIKVATPNARTRFGEVDVGAVDYGDGTSAVGGPGEFWAGWRDDSGAWDSAPSGGGLSGVMPGAAQVPVVMPVAEVVSVSRVPSSSANDVSVR